MSLLNKLLIVLGAISIIGLLSIIVYQQIQLGKKQDAIEMQVVKQKELVDGITRSMNEFASKKDIDQFIKDNGVNLKAIQDDLSKLHAAVSSANSVVVISGGQKGNNIPTTNTGPVNPNPVDPANPDPFGYSSHQQNLALNEDFSGVKVPIGQVGFSAWQKEPWSIDIKPREYHAISVVGVDENQRTYFYNKFTLKVDNKDYDIKINSAETKQIYPEAKFSWWNPRLFLGVDGGVNTTQLKGEITPNLSLGIMSYGQYKTQPDFSILQIGVGYGTVSQTAQVSITPVSYNIGKHLPLMNNLYIGPSVSLSSTGSLSIMGGIKVGL